MVQNLKLVNQLWSKVMHIIFWTQIFIGLQGIKNIKWQHSLAHNTKWQRKKKNNDFKILQHKRTCPNVWNSFLSSIKTKHQNWNNSLSLHPNSKIFSKKSITTYFCWVFSLTIEFEWYHTYLIWMMCQHLTSYSQNLFMMFYPPQQLNKHYQHHWEWCQTSQKLGDIIPCYELYI